MPIEIKQPSKYKCSICSIIHDTIERCISCENRGFSSEIPKYKIGDEVYFYEYELTDEGAYVPDTLVRKVTEVILKHSISYSLDEPYYAIYTEDYPEKFNIVGERELYHWVEGVCDLEEEHDFLKITTEDGVKTVRLMYDEKGYFYEEEEGLKKRINGSILLSYLAKIE